MQFGSGVSTNANTRTALEQALRAATRTLNFAPDLIVAFASPHHLGAIETAAVALAETTSVHGVSLGVVAGGVVADDRQYEETAALSVWAASLPGVELQGSRLRAHQLGEELAVSGWRQPDSPVASILLADPYSFPAAGFVATLPTPTVGGLADSGVRRQALFLGGHLHSDGGVAVSLGGSLSVRTIVSPGGRPIGAPAVITGVDGQKLFELGGRTALEFLEGTLDRLKTKDRHLAASGLLLGVVLDEYAGDYAAGEFLAREVLGVDESDGSIVVSDRLAPGQTVQFHIRDPDWATSDLRRRLGESSVGGGALLFTGSSRGQRFFGEPDRDSGLAARALQPDGMAGMLTAGEIGPVAGLNHLHAHSATLLVLGN